MPKLNQNKNANKSRSKSNKSVRSKSVKSANTIKSNNKTKSFNKSKSKSLGKPNGKLNKKFVRKNTQTFTKHSQNENEQQQQQNSNALVERARLQRMSISQQMELLKQLHNKIIIAPEENIKHLQTMFSLIKTPNLKIVSTALRVLAQTFINIAPLQAVDVGKIEQRTENKITKQEYKVIRFEKVLVEQYDRYIKMLKQMHLKTKPENFKNDQQIYKQFKKCILECVIKCYRTLWNFNLAKQLNQLCLKFIKYEECRLFLKEMLMDKNMAVISMKAKIIAGIAKIIKTQQFQKRLPTDIIKIINSTYIDSRYLKKDQDSLNYKKKQLKKKLYREQALEQQKQKQMKAQKGTLQMKRKKREQKVKQKLRVREQVNKQFAQGQATIQNKQIVRHNSQILQQLFYIYFKILVQRMNSIFIKDALDGILKFVHLINIELTQSLIEHLDASAATYRQLWKIKKTSELLEVRIVIVFTGQSIINGPLSVYNMDDLKMVTHLFKIFRDINQKQVKITQQIYRLLCITLDQAFVKRRQLSQQVVGSFARQIAITLATKQNIPKIYLLQLLRILAYKYSKISKMFEEDNEGFGLNSFNPMCEDPQCSNAINTEIVSFLKNCKSKQSKEQQILINNRLQKLCKQNYQPKDIKESLYTILQNELEGRTF